MPKSVPVVTLAQGKLRGRTQRNQNGDKFYSFYNIPYAKPPTGIRRFKAPETADQWEEVRDATKRGPPCPQKLIGMNIYLGKENNCLNLNVFSKQLSGEGQSGDPSRPVMVWIHGGGFVSGSNGPVIYGPQYLMMEDIVLVTINYRLGILGFLSIDSDEVDIPGNAGLKDQVMALKWVQSNIRHFGGDPGNVTIFGESAGAASVHYLVLSPMTKGLFRRAIMQSGCAMNFWAQGTKGTDEICKILAYKQSTLFETVNFLRKMSAKKLVKFSCKSRDVFLPGERRFYSPVIEKPRPSEEAFITDTPENIIRSGQYNKVPMIIGYNSREGFLFEIFRKLSHRIQLPTNLVLEMDHQHTIVKDQAKREEIHNKIKQFYYNGENITKKNIEKTILLKSDSLFIYKIQQAIKLHQITNPGNVYVYRMDLDTSLNIFKKFAVTNSWKCCVVTYMLKNKMKKSCLGSPLNWLYSKLVYTPFYGTAHADDLPYLFHMKNSPKLIVDSVEYIAMRRFVSLWTNFAKKGEPTPKRDALTDLLPIKWLPVQGDANYLHLGENLSLIHNPDLERITFWDDLYNQYTVS